MWFSCSESLHNTPGLSASMTHLKDDIVALRIPIFVNLKKNILHNIKVLLIHGLYGTKPFCSIPPNETKVAQPLPGDFVEVFAI